MRRWCRASIRIYHALRSLQSKYTRTAEYTKSSFWRIIAPLHRDGFAVGLPDVQSESCPRRATRSMILTIQSYLPTITCPSNIVQVQITVTRLLTRRCMILMSDLLTQRVDWGIWSKPSLPRPLSWRNRELLHGLGRYSMAFSKHRVEVRRTVLD